MFITAIPSTANTYVSTGLGSSYSNDGGNTWVSLENSISHTRAVFISPSTGWSGGNNTLHKFSSTVLSLKENFESYSFFISPNPSTGIFNISTYSPKPFTLELYDLVGNKLLEQQGHNLGNNKLDFSSQKKGVYFLHILTDEDRKIEKIILH